MLLCGSFGNVTSTFHGIPVLELVLPKLLDLALKAPDVVRAVWSRLPPQLALKIALKAGEIDPEHVHAEDMLPYLSHMTHVDFPMFLRMLRAAGEHTAGDLLPRVDVPVLVVAGERDTFTPPFLATAMAEALPHGRASDGAARHARDPHRAAGARRCAHRDVPSRARSLARLVGARGGLRPAGSSRRSAPLPTPPCCIRGIGGAGARHPPRPVGSDPYVAADPRAQRASATRRTCSS